MRRRCTLVGMGGWAVLAAAGAGAAVTAGKPRRIGWLSPQPRDKLRIDFLDAFVARLTARGYVMGRDLVIDERFAGIEVARLPEMARELVALQPAVIVAAGSLSAPVAMKATRTIPIVAAGTTSPVETGLVASLAHPGGNLTGTTYHQPEIAGKLVEVLKVAAQRVSRIALIWNPDVPGMGLYRPHADRTALELGVTLHYVDVRKPGDFRLEILERINPHALYVTYDNAVAAIMPSAIKFALDRKLPSIGVLRQFAEAGGLLAMSPDPEELDAVIADYVDRILKGASPANLPMRQPSRFQLVVNRRTANAIGLPISKELLLRAHEVID